jgi:branched-chain amino acid transport system substrate-binding protein
MRSPRGFPVIAIFVILALALVACGGAATTAAPVATQAPQATQAQPIRFGVIEPLTGPVAEAGNFVVTGIKLAVDHINSQGGVGGRLLEPVIMDGQCDPQESSNAAELLITREKVPIIIGAYCSSATLAVMPILEAQSVPILVETSSSSKVTAEGTPGYQWVHRISPTSAMEAESAEQYLVKGLGMSKVAQIAVNNDWGRGAADVFKAAVERQGATVLSQDFIDTSAVDFLPQLTAIKNSGADAIIVTTDAPQIIGLLKQYRELGMTQTFLTTGGNAYPVQLVALSSKEVVEGMYSLLFFVPDQPELAGDPELAKWYVQEYRNKGNAEIGLGESFRGFDAVNVLARAFELAGSDLSGSALNEALGKVEQNVLSGHVKFSEDGGRQSRPNVYVVKVVDGKITIPDFVAP